MSKFILGLCSFLFVFAPSANAANNTNLDLFNRMVEVQRDSSGKLIQLVLKPSLTKVSGSEHESLDVTQSMLSLLQEAQQSPELSADETRELANAGWSNDQIKTYNDAKMLLSSSHDLEILLKNKDINSILREFQKELESIMQLNVLARPGEPGYFHDRKLIEKAEKKATSAAETAIGNIPALRVVEFLIHTALGWSEGKRTYCQNALLYYIDKVPASDLGFTDQEVAFIKSSLFERQIDWWDLKRVEKVKKHWGTWGNDRFNDMVQNNAKRLAKYGSKFGTVEPSFTFAFASAKKGNVTYILNTEDHASKLSKDLSLAYDSSAPRQIRQHRIELQLAQIAANLLPAPGVIVDELTALIGSYYSTQKETEGSLYAHLLAEGQTTQARTVLDQTLNPLLIKDLK